MTNMRNEMTIEMLENVNGGYIFNNGESVNPWEVIDWKGNVIECCPTRDKAEALACASGQDTKKISWEMLKYLRLVSK